MIWFELILGGVMGLVTGYYVLTVVGIVSGFIEDTVKLLLQFAGLRVGKILEIVIRIILVNILGYTLIYLPFILVTSFVNDRYFFYIGWWFSLMIGLVACVYKIKSKERR